MFTPSCRGTIRICCIVGLELRMKLLGLSAIALSLISASLCAVAMLFGHSQQLSAAVEAFSFDRCGDSICFKGIVPGVTSTDETLTLLSKFTGTRVARLPIGIPVGGDGLANVFIK